MSKNEAASPSSPSSCAIPRSSRMLRKAPWARALVVTIELNGNEMTYVLGSRDIVGGTDYDIMTPIP